MEIDVILFCPGIGFAYRDGNWIRVRDDFFGFGVLDLLPFPDHLNHDFFFRPDYLAVGHILAASETPVGF